MLDTIADTTDSSIFVLIFLVLVGLLLTGAAFVLFYRRAQKDIAYIRTGVGGEKVILNNGAFVFPVIHELTPINLQTLRIEIVRENAQALITKDPLRVDVTAEFFLRVGHDPQAISTAARALGQRTMHPDGVKELVEAQCVAALRSVAAVLILAELHQKRSDFENNVEQNLSVEFAKNGLELVSVSLTRLDQTDKNYFDPSNVFDAQGLTLLEQIKSQNDQNRNQISRDTELAIKQKDLATRIQKEKLDYEETLMQNTHKQQKASSEAETMQRIEEINIEKELRIEQAQQQANIRQAEIEREVAQAWIETNKIKADFEKISEEIRTARDRAEAERSRIIEIISAEKEAQRQRIIAQANAEVEKLAAEAAQIRYQIEAAGKRALNEAQNLLAPEQIALQVKLEVLKHLPDIIRESVRPLENIEGIKIMHVDGLNPSARTGTGNAASSSNLAEQVVDSALRYRAQMPLIESLLNEVGLKGESINSMTQGVREALHTPDATHKPVPEPHTSNAAAPAPREDEDDA